MDDEFERHLVDECGLTIVEVPLKPNLKRYTEKEQAIVDQFPPMPYDEDYQHYDVVVVEKDRGDDLVAKLKLTRRLQNRGLKAVGPVFWSTGFYCVRAK